MSRADAMYGVAGVLLGLFILLVISVRLELAGWAAFVLVCALWVAREWDRT